MTNVRAIITRYRTQMQAAGLLRGVAPAQLSPQVKAMRPSLTQARRVLQERKPVVQTSPMAILFETTLPRIEHVLVEVGEERAEQIIGRLCEYGQEMIAKHGDKANEHLEELFKDLPTYEARLREENGAEEVIEAYRKFHFEKIDEDYLLLKGSPEGYLRLNLGDKIKKIEIDDDGMISLEMEKETNDSDLVCLRRVKNLRKLNLQETGVSNDGLAHLKGLVELQSLYLWNTQVGDAGLAHLSGLSDLEGLYLGTTQVSDDGLAHLKGLVRLKELDLYGTQVGDNGLSYLRELPNLQWLFLRFTQVSDAGLVHLMGLKNLRRVILPRQISNAGIDGLKRAIPGLRAET